MRVLILTIQTLVHIVFWQIRLPSLTFMILYELKRMVLGEILDDLAISDQVAEYIGLWVEEEDSAEEVETQ